MADDKYDAENFPEEIYLDAFLDVRAAVEAGQFVSGFAHYRAFGRAEIEGKVRPSPFEGGPPGLLTHILPAFEAGAPVPVSPAMSALGASARAIRYVAPPSVPAGPVASFDAALYLAVNPDVAGAVAAGEVVSAEAHWRARGEAETRAGLRPSIAQDALYGGLPPAGADCPVDVSGFDAESYFFTYPDVRAAFGPTAEGGLRHWLDHGRFEARVASGIAPFGAGRFRAERMLARPFGVNMFAPFAATSGLGTAARGILRALQALGIPTELHAFDTSRGPARVTAAGRARVPTYRINLLMANADQLPQLASLYPAGIWDDAYNIAVWAWELAAFRPDWHGSFGAVDEVWTNSDFEIQSIGAVAPVPVHKIRLPVEVVGAEPGAARDHFGIPRDRLVFMLAFDVGSTSARKNPMMVVEAFRAAFKADENVFLVVKFHSAVLEPGITRELNRALRGADNVLIIADRLSAAEMDRLRAACDVLVSAHRSEGFGLNIAEFMALGKPSIATAYSGNLEFFDATVGYPLPYRLVEIEKQSGPYFPHYVWAEPDRDVLVAQFQAVYRDQAEAWARGRRGAERIRAQFGPAQIGQEIRLRLHTLGLATQNPACLAWAGRSRALRGAAPLAGFTPAWRQALMGLRPPLPVISLIVPVYNVRADFLTACIASVRAQSYPNWELCLCDDASTNAETLAVLGRLQGVDARIKIRRLRGNLGIAGASNAAVEMATGAYIAMLDNDDILAPDALLQVARVILADSQIDVVYSDEDKIDEGGKRIDTYFKPDWSPEHLESVMYVLHLLVVRKKLFYEVGGFRGEYSGAQDYDLMLRLSRVTSKIHHIPAVLYHWRAVAGSAAAVVDAKPYALEAGFRALSDHVAQKYGARAWVDKGLLPGTFRVRRQILGNARISILILTNNATLEMPGRGEFRMVDNLVDSILRRTAYRNYEIVVVDNSSLMPAQLERFASLGVRVENFTGPVVPFNYAAKANFAIRVCRTENLVMLNDDMEVGQADWLSSLLEISQDPEIGAVGGRLLHANGTIQHVGCVIGINGGSAHVYHSFPGNFVGYNGFTHVVRNYAAVTGACLATRKSVLAQIGGFDERFAVDFNDIDLCLKMIEGGFRVVYTPFCELFHFEGASAPRVTQHMDERKLFTTRWAKYLANDPYFNPNFARNRFDFTLAPAPGVHAPKATRSTARKGASKPSAPASA